MKSLCGSRCLLEQFDVSVTIRHVKPQKIVFVFPFGHDVVVFMCAQSGSFTVGLLDRTTICCSLVKEDKMT